MTDPVYPPIRRFVTVRATPEAAFRRFTAELASWWPLRSHSVGGDEAETVTMEPRVGGHIVERMRDGTAHVWGTIKVWEPPHRVAFTWHPGQDPHTAQDVAVAFTAEGDRTCVELTHGGFERLGKNARRAHRGYPIGWAYVLGIYSDTSRPLVWVVGGLTAMIGFVQRLVQRTRAAAR